MTMDAPKKDLIAVGKRIREIRESKGISQEDFSSVVGISRNHFSCIERGKFGISIEKLHDIAVALNIEVGELFPPLSELKKMKGGSVTKRLSDQIKKLMKKRELLDDA